MFAAAAANIFSPSKNACMVRVPTLNGIKSYRNDPYRAKVLPSPSFFAASPLKVVSPTIPTLSIPTPQALPPMSSFMAAATFQVSTVVPALHAAVRIPEKEVRSEDVTPAPSTQAAPSAAPSANATKHFAVVQFKHTTSYYVAPFRVSVGDYVFVEGDRGENLGMVHEITTEVPTFPVPCKILRRASQKDKDALNALRRKEAVTTRAVIEMAEQTGFMAKIVDTEFQFDGNKLTVFFASKGPVDFRKLQRGLFRDFRCRIWLVNWNEVNPSRTNSSVTSPR